MSPFRTVEAFNRMVAFEGGKALAAEQGITGEAARGFAHNVVENTQFLGGPFSKPMALQNTGLTSRMFMQYPTRLAWFYYDALRKGDIGKLGLMAAGSAAATEIGRAFGIDMSGFSSESGLPIPQQPGDRLFGALPIVPPIYQLLGGAAVGATTGDFQYLQQALPMLAPGGMAASRALATFSPAAARVLGRKYADYENPDPATGAITVYKPNGVAVGQYTPTQIYMMAAGLKPDDMAQEQEFAHYLQVQGKQMSMLRQTYITAWSVNDVNGMEQANDQFKSLYGEGISVKPSTVRAMQDRRMMTRSQVLMKQLPQGVRPEFNDMMAGAMAERMGDFDPEQSVLWGQ
jgi:hypothetical protein